PQRKQRIFLPSHEKSPTPTLEKCAVMRCALWSFRLRKMHSGYKFVSAIQLRQFDPDQCDGCHVSTTADVGGASTPALAFGCCSNWPAPTIACLASRSCRRVARVAISAFLMPPQCAADPRFRCEGSRSARHHAQLRQP